VFYTVDTVVVFKNKALVMSMCVWSILTVNKNESSGEDKSIYEYSHKNVKRVQKRKQVIGRWVVEFRVFWWVGGLIGCASRGRHAFASWC